MTDEDWAALEPNERAFAVRWLGLDDAERDAFCRQLLAAIEVLQRFDLTKRIIPFHRCVRCNHPLEPVSKEAVLDRLEPLTKQYFDEFQICPACGQIYWKGSHYERMTAVIRTIVPEDRES